MRRLAELEHPEVRDVDDVVERANTDAFDSCVQPLRAGSDFHIVDLAGGEKRTFARGADGYAGLLDVDLRVARCRLEFLSSQRGDFACESEVAQQIATVWRDLDVENRIRGEKITDRRADFCIWCQNQ